MAKGKVRPEHIDFGVTPGNEFFARYFGAETVRPRGLTPRFGTKMMQSDGSFYYYIPPDTQITEKNAYMFEHNRLFWLAHGEQQEGGKKESQG